MDTFNNNSFPWESEPSQSQVPQPSQEPQAAPQPQMESPVYRSAGADRKDSPYADSPYVMNHQQVNPAQNPYQPQNPADPYQPKYYAQSYQPVNPPAPPKKKEKKSGAGRRIVAALLTVALVGGACAGTAAIVNSRWETETQEMTDRFNRQIQELQEQIDKAADKPSGHSVSGSPVASVDGLTPGQVYAMNVDAVVAVSNQMVTQYYGQTSQATSSGSGFIITEDGYVISNYHVVEGATTLTVITNDGKEHPAALKGYDATNDLALLKIEGQGFPCVTMGSSDDLIVGDQVVAIGNPLGELTNTLTVGYVSAKDRVVSTDGTIITMIQTDAAINSGNSGGPLFNMKGEVVGITSAKYSGTTSSGASIEGIGFAIPMDDVQKIVEDLMNFGYVTGAYMGVMVRNMDAEVASIYRLPVGAYVDSVEPGGAADRAGIQAGDIILSLGDVTISNITDLTRALRDYKAGQSGAITVYREGRRLEITVVFDEKAQQQTAVPETEPQAQPETQPEATMPNGGSFEDWFNYFSPFGNNGG